MARLLVLQHRACTQTGWVGAWARNRGHTLEVRRPVLGDRLPDPATQDGVVVFGGPQSANDTDAGLTRELQWIEKALRGNTRLFGICLGAQLMAKALGAAVGPHPDGAVECGFAWIDPADAPAWLAAPHPVYHWHQDGFTLPDGATLLARGRGPFPVQGFVRGRALGVQFHPEVTPPIIARWLDRDPHDLHRPGARPAQEHHRLAAAHRTTSARWIAATLDRWVQQD